jgi:TonB family protein
VSKGEEVQVRHVGYWLISFVAVFNVATLAATDDQKVNAKCSFDTYRPLKVGTPIRGGHDQLAIKKVSPAYPPEARQKGIAGRVVVSVLVNRAGDVVKTCATGEPLLAKAAEDAVSQWRFKKDFGFSFSGHRPIHPQYAVLNLTFDFQPDPGRSDASLEAWACTQKSSVARDEHGAPIWLNSEDLFRRAVHKTDLAFPMLDRGRLHGVINVDVLIDARGNVACALAISGHPIAIASAMSAIRTWRFKPFTQDAQAIPVFGHLVIPYDTRQVGRGERGRK